MRVPVSARFEDAYTGRDVRVFMDDASGSPLYCAPEATSPRSFYDSMDDAMRTLGPALVCPYTGEALRPVRDGDAVMFVGGWDPRRPIPRQDFLRYASMRAGESPVSPDARRIEPVDEKVPLPVSHAAEPTQEAIETVLEATEPARRKRRRGRR